MLTDVKLAENPDFDKYKYSRYGIGFDECWSSSLSDSSGFWQKRNNIWCRYKFVCIKW